eukprot:5749722-Pyramimonas_sp.AAC.1
MECSRSEGTVLSSGGGLTDGSARGSTQGTQEGTLGGDHANPPTRPRELGCQKTTTVNENMALNVSIG